MENEQTTVSPKQAETPLEQNAIPKQERDWALAAHIASLSGYLFPLGNILAPLIIWQMKKEEMPFVAQEAKESLNFNISVTIYAAIAFLAMFILIGFILLPIVILGHVILTIMTGIKAGEGKSGRYPFTIRLIS